MKKINMLKLLALVAIANAFTGCGCKNEVQLYLPQDFKDCRTFPEGSWWIYSLNGETKDTLTLTVLDSFFLELSDCIETQNCRVVFNTSYINKTIGYSPTLYYDNLKNGDSMIAAIGGINWINNSDALNGEGFASDIIYFGAGCYGITSSRYKSVEWQIEKGNNYWLDVVKDTIINNKQTEIIAYRTFSMDTLKSYGFNKPIEDAPPHKVYYARGIGLIKKEMIGKARITVFDLKDCRKVIEEYFESGV